MTDCHVCGLPTEAQVHVEADEETWVTLVCVNLHLVVVRASDLDGVV